MHTHAQKTTITMARRATMTMVMATGYDNNDDGNGRQRRCEAEARDNRRSDNQPANERQTGREAPEDKRRWGLDGH